MGGFMSLFPQKTAVAGFIRRHKLMEFEKSRLEQHIELCPEQVLPTLAQVREQRLLVWQQLVQAAVERILLHQRVIRAQKIPHRALLEPLPVQAPLASGINQSIANQRLQDVLPASSLP